MNKALSIWHLHDVYSLDEAAWLIAGESPSEDHSAYDVYSSARGALEKAIHDFGGNELEALVYSMPIGEHFRIHDPFIEKETLQADLALFRPTLDYKYLANVTIPKPALIQWLDHKKHYPPFFFPEKSGKTTPKEPKEATPKKEPTYTTPRLDILNDAIDYFWVGVDPKSKHAPTNDNVKDWILEAFGKKGLKQSENIAAAMATIIRHPDKP